LSLKWPEGFGLAIRIVIAQLAAALVAAIALSFVAFEQATGALLGGIGSFVPTAAFAVCATRWRKARPIVLAGALKPFAIVGLMAVALVLAKPPLLGFLVGIVAVHLAYVVAPLLDRNGRTAAGFESSGPGRGAR